jgi:HlyD family secretion protein
VAQSNYDKVAGQPDVAASPQALALQQATLNLDAAKSNYEGVVKGATTPELDQARAGLNQAVAGVIQASAAVSQTEAALVTARAGLAAEQARLDLMLAGTRPEQIKTAEAQVQAAAGQVAVAEANLALLDTQIGRLSIRAPAGAVVLTRAIEPGETALPGGTLVVLGDLARLSLTVYLPEDRYGAVHVGDRARVTVDSYPGQTFAGTVERVADQAEFTPRNVQTPAGRRTTVFAVKLSIANPEGQLKPGMPADVVFAL